MNVFDDIKESNRNEIIAIPFYGWIKNPVETIIRVLMNTGNYMKWCNKYPFLRAFPINDQNRLFSMTMQYTMKTFRDALVTSGKNTNIPENVVDANFSEMVNRCDPDLSCMTIMEFMIMKLLKEDFVKAIYVYEPVMTPSIKKYMAKIFTENTDKIYMVETNIKNIIESNDPKFTTVYVEDLDMFMDILQLYDEEARKKYMSDTLYVMPAKSSLTDQAKRMCAEMGVLPTEGDVYRYQKFLESSLMEVGSGVNFLQLKAINITNNNGGNHNDITGVHQ